MTSGVPGRAAGLRGLYAITPDWTDHDHLLSVTGAILRGGCRLLQFRNKTADAARRHDLATALRDLTRRYGARLIINDDLALALAIGADGVHLGATDGDLGEARRALGHGPVLGASCYADIATAERARSAGADYVAFGSFFPSPSKPSATSADPALLTASAPLGLPVAAIGGITLDNGGALVRAGASLLAVISAVYNAADPERASRAFQQLIDSHRPS